MSNRPKCAFTDCDNPVMKGETTGRLLSVCRECYERDRMLEWEPSRDTLILCTKQRAHGGYALWWGPEGRGYYAELEAAGRYTMEEAEWICRGIDAHPVPLREAMATAVTVADYPMPRQEGSNR